MVADRFRIVGIIARGSMGKVYQARQMPLDRAVAVKILDIRDDKVSGEGFGQRFLREASVLARLSHANTVRIFDYGIWEGRSFLVMEYIEGNPLSNFLNNGALPPGRALSIGAQISASLREAHQQGIVHRDLKPSNVLITRQGDAEHFVKVIDFGLGKEIEEEHAELTVAGQVLGSPMYMAPEQVRSEEVDQRADIYALGVVLYRMLTGARPYPQRGTPALMYAHLNEQPRPFSESNPELDLPPCVEWTVMCCLEKDPSNRFWDAGELQRALKACWIALEESSYRNMTLDISEGMTILPPELSDISADSIVLTPRRPPGAAVANVQTKEQQKKRTGGLWMFLLVAAVLMLIVFGGYTANLAGLFSEQPDVQASATQTPLTTPTPTPEPEPLVPDAEPALPPEDGSAEDGSAEDGTVEDGAVEDGAVEDGAVEEEDGAATEEATPAPVVAPRPRPRPRPRPVVRPAPEPTPEPDPEPVVSPEPTVETPDPATSPDPEPVVDEPVIAPINSDSDLKDPFQ
ncbi:MAG: serine/threonine-protein kinase [Myxococcota bacterium]